MFDSVKKRNFTKVFPGDEAGKISKKFNRSTLTLFMVNKPDEIIKIV